MMVKTSLKASFLALFAEMQSAPMSDETFAERMADIIDGYIRTAEIDSATGRYSTGTLVAGGTYPVTPVTGLVPEVVDITGGLK